MFVNLVLFMLSFAKGEHAKPPNAIYSVGVGYNILYGNPVGTDWRHGGEDPGLLVTKQILSLGRYSYLCIIYDDSVWK